MRIRKTEYNQKLNQEACHSNGLDPGLIVTVVNQGFLTISDTHIRACSLQSRRRTRVRQLRQECAPFLVIDSLWYTDMKLAPTSLQQKTPSRVNALATLPVIRAGLLSGCGPGTTGTAEQPDAAPGATAVTGPSVSAAELTNDGVNSISFAQAVAAGVIARPQPTNNTTPDTGAANPLAPIPTTDSVDAGLIDQNATPTNAPTALPDTPAASETPGTDVPGSNPDSNANPDSNSIPEVGPDTGNTTAPPIVTAGPEPAENPDAQQAQTEFFSQTTPGFNGQVLDDTIRVTWPVDPNARGYNVYRQAEFVTSVFTNEYIDEDVFDHNYYYEIQAFDQSDTLYYVATGLTVAARTFGRVDPDVPVADPDLLADYDLVFADEFNGESLDASKWNTAYLWGTELVINSEEQYYVDINNKPDFGFNPFTFDGEHLTINSVKTPDALLSKSLNQPYLSGVITSYDAFKFTYGYVETRAKVTHGRGYWPAFWLLNAYYVDDKPEIDIMEFIGHNQDVVYHTYHYYDSEGQLRSTKSQPTPGIDYTADFHTYAVDWKPGTLIFYINGIEVHRITDAKVSRQEMYVIANTALGGWWAGSPDETTPFPGEYIIDYIRVYQRRTPYDDVLLNDGITQVPYADDIPGQTSPSHRPPIELWPEGYPDGL